MQFQCTKHNYLHVKLWHFSSDCSTERPQSSICDATLSHLHTHTNVFTSSLQVNFILIFKLSHHYLYMLYFLKNTFQHTAFRISGIRFQYILLVNCILNFTSPKTIFKLSKVTIFWKPLVYTCSGTSRKRSETFLTLGYLLLLLIHEPPCLNNSKLPALQKSRSSRKTRNAKKKTRWGLRGNIIGDHLRKS